MGWRPADVRACTVAEFHAALAGWVKANSTAGDEISDDDFMADLTEVYRKGQR